VADYCVKCAQYQLLFPALLSVIEQISENKVIFHDTFCLEIDCDFLMFIWC